MPGNIFSCWIGKEKARLLLFILAAGVFIFASSQQTALLAAVALLLAVAINLNFNFFLYFLLVVVPITRFPVITEHVEIIQYLLFSSVLIFWAAKKNFNDLCRFKKEPLSIFFISFFSLMALNLIFSANTFLTGKAFLTHFIAFGYFYLFLDFFKDRRYLRKASYVLIFMGTAVALLAILQYLVVRYKIFTGLERFILPYNQRHYLILEARQISDLLGYRSVGTFYHPNLLGVYLSMALPLVFSYAFLFKNKLKKIFFIASSLIILGGIFCSNSRGAFLSIMVSFAFLAVIFWKRISKPLLLLFLAVVAVIIYLFRDAIIYYFRLEDILSYRNFIWTNTLDMISQKPFIGWGLGTFHQVYTNSYGLTSLVDFQNTLRDIVVTGSAQWLQGFHAHNVFLNYAAEMGVFAPVLIVLFYALYLKRAFSIFRSRKSLNIIDYILIMASVSVMLGSFVHGFFEATTNFYDFSIAISFVFIASIGASLASHYESKPYA